MSLFYLAYLLRFKPFESYTSTKMEILNEAGILLISYQTYLFNGYVADPETRYFVGWFTIITVLAIITVNITVIAFINWVQVKRKLILKCN